MNRISTLLNNEAVISYTTNLASSIRECLFSKKYLSRLPRQRYIILNNILLEKDGGGTTQIDHIVVSPYGIFVIEEKNLRGNVWGLEDDPVWRSYYPYSNGQKYFKFQNPLRQNYCHVSALKNIIPPQMHDTLISVISFTETPYIRRCNLNTKEHIVVSEELSDIIMSYWKPVLSIDEVWNIVRSIQRANTQSPENHKKHIESLRQKYQHNTRPISS